MSRYENESNATWTETESLVEEIPGIYRSRYDIENFFFTNRIDMYSVVEPGEKVLFPDVGHARLCGTNHLDKTKKEFNVNWQDMQVFITHFHADHDGNVPYLLDKGVKDIFISEYIPYSDARLESLLIKAGFEEKKDFGANGETQYLMGKIDEDDCYFDKATVLQEGDVIPIAGYDFEVMSTPGHSSNHACLIERSKGILFAGDHILDSAPGLMQLSADEDILEKYLVNLDYLRTCGLEHIFMCHADSLHGNKFVNAFLTMLIDKYNRPLKKVYDLAQSCEGFSAYQIAERYYQRIPGGLASEPDHTRGRRVTIQLGYLEYLCKNGMLGQEDDEHGVRRYFPLPNCQLVLPSERFARY